MKGYFFILVLMATSYSVSAGSALTSSQKSATLFTELTTKLFQEGIIVIYQGLHETTLDIANVGTAVGTLLDATGSVVWNQQFDTPKEISFEHSRYDEGMYDFILEKPDGTLLESVSFEMK